MVHVSFAFTSQNQFAVFPTGAKACFWNTWCSPDPRHCRSAGSSCRFASGKTAASKFTAPAGRSPSQSSTRTPTSLPAPSSRTSTSAPSCVIRTAQVERDRIRLASSKLTLRQKDRIRAAGEASRAQGPAPGGAGAVAAFLAQFAKDQKQRTKTQTLRAAQRRKARARGYRTGHFYLATETKTFLLGVDTDGSLKVAFPRSWQW